MPKTAQAGKYLTQQSLRPVNEPAQKELKMSELQLLAYSASRDLLKIIPRNNISSTIGATNNTVMKHRADHPA